MQLTIFIYQQFKKYTHLVSFFITVFPAEEESTDLDAKGPLAEPKSVALRLYLSIN
jgi:hypothetical protein